MPNTKAARRLVKSASQGAIAPSNPYSAVRPLLQSSAEPVSDLLISGWLYKWTNYIKGYQKRWFVLRNGILAYYRNPADGPQACRGAVNLVNSLIHIHDSCCFVVRTGATKTLHLKTSSEVERQRWVVTLELAKAKAISFAEAEEDCGVRVEPHREELAVTIRNLTAKVDDLQKCSELVNKHSAALQRALLDLEKGSTGTGGAGVVDTVQTLRTINERASLFRITTSAMIGACNDYVGLAEQQGTKWRRLMEHERDQRRQLEDLVELLGKQHCSLEKRIRRSLVPTGIDMEGLMAIKGREQVVSEEDDDEDDDDFFDAFDDLATSEFMLHKRSSRDGGKAPVLFSQTSLDVGIGSTVGRTPVFSTQTSSDSVESLPNRSSFTPERRPVSVSLERDQVRQRRASFFAAIPDLNGDGVAINLKAARRSIATNAVMGVTTTTGRSVVGVRRIRRDTIPEKPVVSLSVWSIMKNCIGKDLSKIPFPVNFSEPLSFLQRLTEDFEYSSCLDRAATFTDVSLSCLQMLYVAAFTVSSYANTTLRTGKPFNPLLGETYECDRTNDEEYGWRSFAEQVSHHPPMVSMYTEGRGWTFWQEFTMSSKFRGKYMQIVPLGIAHLLFPTSGNHYTWRKVTTTVHNIIVGSLWVDNSGEMDIINHRTGDKCHLKYSAYSYFSRDTPPRKVTGVVTDSAGVARYTVSGAWDDRIEGAKIKKPVSSKGKHAMITNYETEESFLLWQRKYPPARFARCYNFTQLAVELNEMEEGVAPTDSRHRPDQRLMEQGDWDKANQIKMELEEKQRLSRRRRDSFIEEAAQKGSDYHGYEPKWFRQETDPQTGNLIHVYTGEYWECKEQQDWSRCPVIYL